MGASGSPSGASDAAMACERAEAASRLKALPYDVLLVATTTDAPSDGSFLTLEAYKHYSPLMQLLRQPAQCERIVAWAADGEGEDGAVEALAEGVEALAEDVAEAVASEADPGEALHAELEASFGVESDAKSEDDEAESEGGGEDEAGSDKGGSDVLDEDGLDGAQEELAEDQPSATDEENIHALALQRALKRCKIKSWEALEVSICRRVNRRVARAQRSGDALACPALAGEKLTPPLRLNDVLNARSPAYDAGFARRFRREKKVLVEKTSRRRPELHEPEPADEARFSALTAEQHAWLLGVGPVPELAAALSQQHLEQLSQRLFGLVRHEREMYKNHMQALMQPAAQRRYEHATFRQQRQFEVRADALRARIRDLPRLWKLGQDEAERRATQTVARVRTSPRKRKAEEGTDAAAEVLMAPSADGVTENELAPWTLQSAAQTWDAILALSQMELVSAKGRARPWAPLPPFTAVPGDRTYVTATSSASFCADVEEMFLTEFGAGKNAPPERRGRLGRAAPRPTPPKVVAAAGTLTLMLSERTWEVPVRVSEVHTLSPTEGPMHATGGAVGRVVFMEDPLLPRRLTPRHQQWHLQMRACQALGGLEASGDECTGIQLWSRCRSLRGADLYVLTSAELALERGVSDAAESRQVPLVVHPRLEYFAPPAREEWHPAARLAALASKVLAGPAAALCTPRVHVPQAQVLECPVAAGSDLCGGEGGRNILALWVQRWEVVLEALDRVASLPAGIHLLVHDGSALSVLHAMPEARVQDREDDEGAADEAVPLPPQSLHPDTLYDLHATAPLRGRTSVEPHPFVPPVWEPASPDVPQIPHTFRPRLSETEDAAGARRGGRVRRRRLDGPYAWRALGEKGDFDAVTHISTISRVDYAAALGDEL